VIQYRRLCALLLGAWLGASIVTDVAVTQNFQAVDRFLQSPGDSGTAAQLNAIGRARERIILRRHAAEENNWIFLNWERVEFAIGGGVFLLLLSGGKARKTTLSLSIFLLGIVTAEHFLLTPSITSLGRIVDDLSATDPQYRKFWMLHGLYSGLDILKMLVVFGLAAAMVIRRKPNRAMFAPETAPPVKAMAQGSATRG
jgi:hypothetical protein